CSEIFSETFTSARVAEEESSRPPFEINRKLVVSTGNGHAAMQRFGAVVGLNIMDSRSYVNHLRKVTLSAEVLSKEVLQKSREIVRNHYIEMGPSLADQEVNLTATDLGEDTPGYKEWFEGHIHSGECNINYEGSSGGMEVEAAVILAGRSVEKAKFRYLHILGDGDAKSISAINSYTICEGVEVKKEERANHINKRLGNALREAVKNQNVFKTLLPIHERVSSTELLERCKRLATFNANEAFHSVVWKKCPKTTFISKSRLDIGMAQAVAEFNMGFSPTESLKAVVTHGTLADIS
ncbi:hypothetical protein FOCC_FOCC013929, partial [Frankliniella occidentalis]